MLKTFGVSVAIGLAAICATASLAAAAQPAATEAAKPKPAKSKAKPKAGGYCKTMTGKMVGWGVDDVRAYAERALDSEIAAWEQRSSFTAQPKDRKTDCKIYIEFLNEYECTAQAVVCR